MIRLDLDINLQLVISYLADDRAEIRQAVFEENSEESNSIVNSMPNTIQGTRSYWASKLGVRPHTSSLPPLLQIICGMISIANFPTMYEQWKNGDGIERTCRCAGKRCQ